MSAAALRQLLEAQAPPSSWPPELRAELVMMIDRELSNADRCAGRRHLRLVSGARFRAPDKSSRTS